MIKAFIDNLAWLRASYKDGEFLTLPTSFETAQALFKRLDLADGKHDMAILEYEVDIPGLAKCLSQYDNLDELNYLAALLEGLDEAGRVKFAAAVEHGEYAGEVGQLINLAQNLDCYDLDPDIHGAEALGHARAEGQISLPGDFRFYFDYAALGTDTSINEGGTFTNAGYIRNNKSSFTEHYNGKDIPEEYRLLARPEPEREASSHVDPKQGKEETDMAQAVPLLDNEHVKELISIMQEKQVPTMRDLLLVVNEVNAMEKQLGAAVAELAAMRRELAEAQKQNHPAKDALQKAVITMQNRVLHLRERLAELKQNVIVGCKNAVAAFKEQGAVALHSAADFFHIRPGFTAMRRELDTAIREDDAAIAKIEAISTEYHQAGRHIKNMGRALLGKEAVEDTKAPGKLAAAVSLPFRNERKVFAAMRGGADKALAGLERLEQAAERSRPSINDTLDTLNAQIAQQEARRDTPAPAVRRDER